MVSGSGTAAFTDSFYDLFIDASKAPNYGIQAIENQGLPSKAKWPENEPYTETMQYGGATNLGEPRNLKGSLNDHRIHRSEHSQDLMLSTMNSCILRHSQKVPIPISTQMTILDFMKNTDDIQQFHVLSTSPSSKRTHPDSDIHPKMSILNHCRLPTVSPIKPEISRTPRCVCY